MTRTIILYLQQNNYKCDDTECNVLKYITKGIGRKNIFN